MNVENSTLERAEGLISIIVPVLNEEGNLRPLYQRVASAMRDVGYAFELIVVDDGSTDASVQVVSELHAGDARVKLVSLSRNFGHQLALTAGMDHANGVAVIVMDADLQHPPELIARLIAGWRDGYDIVYTLRVATEGAGWLKQVTSSLFYRVFKRLTGMDLPENVADFRLMDRKVVASFKIIRERSRFLRGLTSWVGFKTLGVPYQASSRLSGASKYSLSRMMRFALDGLVSFSTVPLYVGIYVGLFQASIGFLYSIYILYVRFFTALAIPGWTSVILMIAIGGGIQLILMGVIGLYIGKIFEEVKQRPLYLVQKRLGLG